MSKREKRRRDEAPMPAASAGLLRFFEEDTPGIKLSPQLVVITGVGLVVLALIAYFLLPVVPVAPGP
jgi:preprotein translocase subunit Sec61beta